MESVESRLNSEWNIFPGFDTLQLCGKVKDLLSRLGETPETFTGRILFMSMFNDISCGTKDNEQECLAHARVVSLYARKFGTGQWSFIGPGSEKKWYSIKEDSPQGIWDNIAEKMLVKFAENTCPIFRATTRSKAKAKPQRKELADSSSRIIPINRRNWIDIEPGKHSLSAYEVSKKVIHLLRHSQQVHREEDGAVHFWRIKENLQNQFPQSIHWSDDRWKGCLAAGGGAKRRFQYCTDDSGIIVYFRALQGH